MITLANRMIRALGWCLLMTIVYVAVIVGMLIRSFEDGRDDNADAD